MEVVYDSLDKWLQNNDENLVDEILRFIDPEPKYFVGVCIECGCVDRINICPQKCSVCRQKKKVIKQYENICHLLTFGVDTNNFSSKLNDYLKNLQDHLSFVDMCEDHDKKST